MSTDKENFMSMNKVIVKVDALKQKLIENREAHRALYEKAVEGYLVEARRQVVDLLAKIDSHPARDALPSVSLWLDIPEDHTSDYDQVISMLEMTVHDEVELSNSEFAQYVMDNWGWKKQWTASNAGYTR